VGALYSKQDRIQFECVLALLLNHHGALEIGERVNLNAAICTHYAYRAGILVLRRRVEVWEDAELLGALGPTEGHGQGVIVGYLSVIVVEHQELSCHISLGVVI